VDVRFGNVPFVALARGVLGFDEDQSPLLR
jgi:hypothetical protein